MALTQLSLAGRVWFLPSTSRLGDGKTANLFLYCIQKPPLHSVNILYNRCTVLYIVNWTMYIMIDDLYYCLQGGVFRANLAISKINSETLELTVNMEWYQASSQN
jgi:hypothetical protein